MKRILITWYDSSGKSANIQMPEGSAMDTVRRILIDGQSRKSWVRFTDRYGAHHDLNLERISSVVVQEVLSGESHR